MSAGTAIPLKSAVVMLMVNISENKSCRKKSAGNEKNANCQKKQSFYKIIFKIHCLLLLMTVIIIHIYYFSIFYKKSQYIILKLLLDKINKNDYNHYITTDYHLEIKN